MAEVDCNAIDQLTPTQLQLLFSTIPTTWTQHNLNTAFLSTSESLNTQFFHQLGVTPPAIAPVKSNTPDRLDIFQLRDEVIQDYRTYIESFLRIRDTRVKTFVSEQLDQGKLWTNPLLQLNPSYKPGATVTELVDRGVFHPDCAQYFTRNGQP